MTKAASHKAPAVRWSAPDTVGHGPGEESAASPGRPESPDQAARKGTTDVGSAARVCHWAEPDFVGDIRAVARRAGGADPVEVRVRPELHDRLVRQLSAAGKLGGGSLTDLDGVPLVVDEEIPVLPGYEVHRVPADSGVGKAHPSSSDSSTCSGDSSRAAGAGDGGRRPGGTGGTRRPRPGDPWRIGGFSLRNPARCTVAHAAAGLGPVLLLRRQRTRRA